MKGTEFIHTELRRHHGAKLYYNSFLKPLLDSDNYIIMHSTNIFEVLVAVFALKENGV